MHTKYIITRMNISDRTQTVSACFEADSCVGLQLFPENALAGNMYLGRVENVVKNMNCAFVEIQKGIKCYYPLADNNRHFFLNRKNNTAVNQGDLLLVQVSKEAARNKPPTVTGKLLLTGKYVVLSADVQGVLISAKTKCDEHCQELRKLLLAHFSFQALSDELAAKLPEAQKNIGSYGFILRTNAASAEPDAVFKEAERLAAQYEQIIWQALYGTAFQCVYQAPPKYLADILNIRTELLDEIITDDPAVLQQLTAHLPSSDSSRVRLYTDKLLALCKLYSLENELKQALKKKVWLKCGGYLVIEQTEALCVIDVNSGKCVSKKNDSAARENTYVKVNLEAAAEIARQLRLRNLTGIIIVDFINMTENEHNRALIDALRQLVKQDKVRTTVVDITRLGLVEITRERNGKSLAEAVYGDEHRQGDADAEI